MGRAAQSTRSLRADYHHVRLGAHFEPRAVATRMSNLFVSIVLALAQDAAPAPAPAAAQAGELGPETFAHYRALVAPTAADEEWRTVLEETAPWRATFWQGVIDAQAADRPVLLFTMNGHPFGCT